MNKFIKSIALGLIVAIVLPNVVNAHNVHFETFGGDLYHWDEPTTSKDVEVEDGEKVITYDYSATLDGYMFDQWASDNEFNYYSGTKWYSYYSDPITTDTTIYAYFYDRVYVYTYNKTTGEVDEYAGEVNELYENEEYPCYEQGYCGYVEPYTEETNKITFKAAPKAGYKFVEWRIGFSMPSVNHIKEGYAGVGYNETTSFTTNETCTAVGGNGFITLYAVYEEDSESPVELVSEVTSTVVEPTNGVAINSEVQAGDETKYTVEFDCWVKKGSYNCIREGNFEEGNIYEATIIFTPKDGYRFNKQTIFKVNGTSYEGSVMSDSNQVRVDAYFNLLNNTITYDFNGGTKDNQSTLTVISKDETIKFDEVTLLSGVSVPNGKEFDHILFNGNTITYGQLYSLGATNTIKYIWKDVAPTEPVVTPTPVTPKPNPNLNGFKIAGGNTTSIKLSWNKCDTATSYAVYQSTDNKKWTKLGTTSALTYNKTKLTANKKYYYKVEAYKGSTKLVTSKVITTKTAPKAVTLKAKAKAYNSVKLTLGKTTGAKKFIIEKSTDNKTFTTAKTETKVGTKTVSGLEPGTKYYFRVKACNEYNVCSVSKVVNNTPALKKPTIKVSAKKGQITVKVPAVAGATGYEIQRSLKKGSGYTTIADVKSAKSYADKNGLVAKKKYYYRVRAYRIVNGKKVYSAFSKVTNTKAK